MSTPDSSSDSRRAVLAQALDTIERLEARARAAEDRLGALTEPIAVVGIGCRLPGGVTGPDSYWELLADGRDAVRAVPPERWDNDELYSPDPSVPGSIRARGGGFLSGWEPAEFDAAFFGISPREAAGMDPQHRLMLEVAWEALEHAGVPAERVRGSRTGVFVGITSNDYVLRQFDENPVEDVDGYMFSGFVPNYSAGRIAYVLGAQGPTVALDTACSSSLVTVHLGCQALRTGEADMVLAGGVHLMMAPQPTMTMSRWGGLAPDGRCKAFDASADGLGRGEGAGAVVLKRLSDAVRDGDRVLAVVRGTGVNQDGASSGITVPNGTAQEALIRHVLGRSGLGPDDVDYVEAHGTGTPLGDPIELEALGAVFGDRAEPLQVGSVKTNLAHCEGAAGVASFAKTVLAVQHGEIPPHLHFTELNPKVGTRARHLAISGDGLAWPERGRVRRAGVSAFGVTGTNAHVIVEQAPPVASPAGTGARAAGAAAGTPADTTSAAAGGGLRLVPLSAASTEALRGAAAALADRLEAPDAPAFAQVGAALAHRRTQLTHRLAVVAADSPGLAASLRGYAADEPLPGVVDGIVPAGADTDERPVFVFSGFGSQWAGMGLELIATESAFGRVVDELDAAFAPYKAAFGDAGFSIRRTLETGAEWDRVWHFVVLYAMQLGLAAVWQSYGVRPAAVLGHSLGEIAAATVAGAITPAEGALVVVRRSAALMKVADGGTMAMVALPPDDVEKRLVDVADVTVAVRASSRSAVVTGPMPAVDALVEAWTEEGLLARRVAGVAAAGHSPQVEPLLPELRSTLAALSPKPATLPVYSTALDSARDTPAFDGAYWAANFRNPVRFADAVAAAAEDGHRVFLEISPHPLVTQAVQHTMQDAGSAAGVVAHTIRRNKPEQAILHTQLATVWCAGVGLDWDRLAPEVGPSAAGALPTTVWQHVRHWYETGRRAAAGAGDHPLLGVHVRLPGTPAQDVWQARVGTDALPWLSDHRSGELVVLPGTGYVEMALAAATRAFEVAPERLLLTDVEFRTALVLAEPVTVTTTLTRHGTGSAATTATVEVTTDDGVGRVVHATARVALLPEPAAPEVVTVDTPAVTPPAVPSSFDKPDEMYAGLRAAGQHHGPAFQAVTGLVAPEPGSDTTVGTVELPPAARAGLRRPVVHPVLLDACLQVLGAVPAGADYLASAGGGVLVPVRFGAVRYLADPAGGTTVRASLDTGGEPPAGRVELLDPAGRVLVRVEDVRLALLRTDPEAALDRLLYELDWEPGALTAPDPARAVGRRVVVGDAADPLVADAIGAGAEGSAVVDPALSAADLAARFADELDDIDGPGGPPSDVLVVAWPAADDARLREADPDGAVAAAEAQVLLLIRVVQALAAAGSPAPPRLWVVTRGAEQTRPGETVAPEQAALRGLVRTAVYEHPELRATLVDLDHAAGSRALVEELAAGAADDEVAWRGGDRLVARVVRGRAGGDAAPAPTGTGRFGVDGFRLESRHRGRLDTLELRRTARRAPGAGEVEVAVRAAGVNFSDVLKALDAYVMPEGDERALTLGGEFAGVVTAVGAGVEGLAVGDRVAGMAAGCFGSFVTAPAELVLPIPAGLSFAQAATLPVAYGTAWYSLHHLARLEAGESLLVHAASGGVGLAAVAIAQAVGAEVYATAGRDSKREFLRRERGLTHVMDSRSLDFADQTLADTGGHGVDVVLNSLSGEALARGLDVLAPHGRFVEMGKRDIHEDMRLGLSPFGRGLTLSHVDLDLVVRTRPALGRRVLAEVFAEVEAGRLAPLPVTEYALTDAAGALRTMAAADHVGKLVLTMPADGEAPVVAGDTPLVVPGAGYAISAGLSGIGLFVARELAARGAGVLALNARSAPSPEAETALAEIRSGGTEVVVVRGDVAEAGTAERLVAAVEDAGARLAGVVHSAAWLDDGVLGRMSADQLDRAWLPKAVGAWRLHAATEGRDLDWWVGFSTTTSLFGAPGQGNYAAASAYVDGLAQWRAAQGLPALAVNWGAWAEVGRGQALADRGFTLVTPAQGIAALERLVREHRTRTAVVPFDPAVWFAGFPSVAGSSLFAALAPAAAGEAGTTGPTRAVLELMDLPAGPRRRVYLENYVADRVRGVLRLGNTPIDPSASLSSLGLDSLMVLELRNQLEAGLGLALPATLAFSHPTLAALAKTLGERLGADLAGEADDDEDEPAPPVAELAEPAGAELNADDQALLSDLFAAAETPTTPEEGT